MSVEYKHEISSINSSKKLMCIEYPGLVNNVDKMLHTLGGLNNIGIAYSAKNRRVELRFRPDDIYCKPTCGDKHNTTALLLKIKVKKQTRDVNTPCSSKDADKPQIITFSTSLIGVVDTIYKFNNLCDFQYLPMDLKSGESHGGKLESILDRLRPNFLPNFAWLEENNVPLFLTPAVFSRFDTVHYYNSQKVKDPNVNSRTIGRKRKRRTGYALLISNQDENVPKAPVIDALKMLQIKFLTDEHYEKMKKLFEERPVWSKSAIAYASGFSKDKLKFLLPTVAFYFTTGPWRVMWVRYGYDPRNHPESRIYQTFDYRTAGGLKNKVKAKRSYSNCLLPYKSSHVSRPKVAIITRHSIARAYKAANELPAKETIDENFYIFRPGVIPPFRQIFYQYCDVLVPEIQTRLSRLPMPGPDEKCDPRSGWLPKDFDSRCREIISNLVNAEIRKQILQQQKQKKKEQKMEEENVPDEEIDELEPEIEQGGSKEIEISDTDDSDSDLDLDDSEDDVSDNFIDSDIEDSLKES